MTNWTDVAMAGVVILGYILIASVPVLLILGLEYMDNRRIEVERNAESQSGEQKSI